MTVRGRSAETELTERRQFQIDQRHDADRALRLTLLGELDVATADQLSGRLGELKRNNEPVRLDLSQIAFVDSSGIRVLILAMREARRDGWQLQIDRELAPQFQRLIDVLGIASFLWPENGH